MKNMHDTQKHHAGMCRKTIERGVNSRKILRN